MKIPKDYHRRLTELSATIPKLSDHTVALIFVNENQAQFFSFEGKDQKSYPIYRQQDECEVDFHRRAKEQARERFPKSEMIIISHEEYNSDALESDPVAETLRFCQSKKSRRNGDKILKDVVEYRARRVKD